MFEMLCGRCHAENHRGAAQDVSGAQMPSKSPEVDVEHAIPAQRIGLVRNRLRQGRAETSGRRGWLLGFLSGREQSGWRCDGHQKALQKEVPSKEEREEKISRLSSAGADFRRKKRPRPLRSRPFHVERRDLRQLCLLRGRRSSSPDWKPSA